MDEGQFFSDQQQSNSKYIFGSYLSTLSLLQGVIILFIYYVYKQWKSSQSNNSMKGELGLKDLRGPRSLDPTGIVGSAWELLPFEKSLTTVSNWAEKYGDFFKISALNETWVVLNSAPTIQTLLKSSDMGHLIKVPVVYDLLKPHVTNGVLVSRGKFWQHERRILFRSQSYQSLKAYVPFLNKHCKQFVVDLKDLFKDGNPHQVNGLINPLFIKIICEVIFGFDCDKSDDCIQYHHNFQIWKEAYLMRLLYPWYGIDLIWKLHPMSRKNDKAVAEMFDFAKRHVREHKNKDKPKCRSVLDELLDANVEESQIIDEINTMIFGGHETGAGVIHCFCFCMALNQANQKECQSEVDEVFDDPSSWLDGNLTYDAATNNLKVVERCILETMRLYPAIFAFFRKLYSPLKITHNDRDYVLPIGTNVAIPLFTLHKKPEYFTMPEKFDPDRFLPEELAKRHPFSYLSFSAGARNCLGLKFAMLEMKLIATYILRNFTMTTTDSPEDIPMIPYITLTPARDFTFQFVARNIQSSTK